MRFAGAAAGFVLAFSSLGFASAAMASPALRLPMLAERIAKLQAQSGQDILPQRSRRALDETLRDFDSELRAATASAPNPEVRDNYVLLGLLWSEYRDWAVRPATRENARKVRERSEEVVWVASKGARLLYEHSRAGLNGAAVRAAQGALLSQRIPKLYLWRRWEMRDESLARELREAEDNLARTLEDLRAAPANTPEVAAELDVAGTQLRFMSDAAAKGNLEFIVKAGDNILESMERIGKLYEAAR
jgi:hypothetical protein